MKKIEDAVVEKYLGQQELPLHKQIPDRNYIDWANIGAREAQRWISVEDELPEEGLPCIVKNKADNLCICFMKYEKGMNGEFKSKGWFNYWYGRRDAGIIPTPIKAIITHWRYVDRK